MVRHFPKAEKNAGFAFFFLFLYTISVLIRPHEFTIETSKYIFIQVFAILAFLLTLVSLRPIRFLPQHHMLLLFTPLIMMSAVLNGWGGGGIIQAERFFVSSIIPFFLFSNLITSISRQKLLMYVCLVAAMFMIYNGHIQQKSFDGLYGYGIGGTLSMGREEMRITYLGFFNDPNDLGMFLVMNIPFVGYFFSEKGGLNKVLMPIIFVAILYGIYMTGSRGTLLGAFGVIALYFMIRRAGAKLILFGALMAPILATLIASFGGMSAEESSANGRLEAWYAGIQMLISNPLFGVGMGNFMDYHDLVAHNSYIHVAGEMGVPGYSLWAGAIILSMLTAYVFIKNPSVSYTDLQDDDKKSAMKRELKMNHTLFFSIVGFMITGFFLSRQFTLLLFIYLGMLTASHIRIIKLNPEMAKAFDLKSTFRCMGYSWAIIIAVYITLKIGL